MPDSSIKLRQAAFRFVKEESYARTINARPNLTGRYSYIARR
jgi:hypothetical protein